MKFLQTIFAVFVLCALAYPAQAGLDYPSHRATTSVPIAVSNIVVKNASRVSGRSGGFGSGSTDNPVADIQNYINARYTPSGQEGQKVGQTLVVKITRASIVNKGRSRFGEGQRHIDITLDLMLTQNGMTPTKTARVKHTRYVNDGHSGGGALPITGSTNIMKDAIQSIDRQMLAAMKNQLGLLR